ncbi:MAG: isochorismatase [Gemmatimonadales bacterium]|nr:isochorismatase [Gemmatimonadales bacterium]NIN11109.1 isochorismatase [Gemmatimonadales bacterium]NIN49706.1 isochorismatase [Gemmatimonadales bacterium]NIP07170.1 isochorismatase [Gemmatimonadales bacterium]NIQ99562.1 isochorismatase [Gemmatimonadales bacterium]
MGDAAVPQLPVPPHFDPQKVGEIWRVDYQRRAQEAETWAARHRIRPASTDEVRICLMVVDCQNTFCIPGYELFVAGRSGNGAVEDNVRLCEFIYRNLARITEIAPTMDTHTAIQIFHPMFWVNDAGEHPKGAETVITLEDVQKGVWKVNPAVADSVAAGDYDWLSRHVLHYVERLVQGRYPLMVWPYHAMLGSVGHALVSAVEEAIFFHSVARQAATRFEVKGDNPLTENYSVLRPEVLDGPGGKSIAEKNTRFIERLLDFDVVVIAGQAKSHCVAWTIHDLLNELKARTPGLAEKVYILEDCTSPVVVPGVVDFTEQADEAFQQFADNGMHLVRSVEPIEAWAGIKV